MSKTLRNSSKKKAGTLTSNIEAYIFTFDVTIYKPSPNYGKD
jgi:hypothetical protein